MQVFNFPYTPKSQHDTPENSDQHLKETFENGVALMQADKPRLPLKTIEAFLWSNNFLVANAQGRDYIKIVDLDNSDDFLKITVNKNRLQTITNHWQIEKYKNRAMDGEFKEKILVEQLAGTGRGNGVRVTYETKETPDSDAVILQRIFDVDPGEQYTRLLEAKNNLQDKTITIYDSKKDQSRALSESEISNYPAMLGKNATYKAFELCSIDLDSFPNELPPKGFFEG